MNGSDQSDHRVDVVIGSFTSNAQVKVPANKTLESLASDRELLADVTFDPLVDFQDGSLSASLGRRSLCLTETQFDFVHGHSHLAFQVLNRVIDLFDGLVLTDNVIEVALTHRPETGLAQFGFDKSELFGFIWVVEVGVKRDPGLVVLKVEVVVDLSDFNGTVIYLPDKGGVFDQNGCPQSLLIGSVFGGVTDGYRVSGGSDWQWRTGGGIDEGLWGSEIENKEAVVFLFDCLEVKLVVDGLGLSGGVVVGNVEEGGLGVSLLCFSEEIAEAFDFVSFAFAASAVQSVVENEHWNYY